MSFIRSTALRASSVARAARPAIRVAQPLRQSIQRRTYASGHGHGEAKSSDVPWMAAAVASTVGGLYVILTQDLSHGSHDEHADHEEKHEEAPEEEAPAEEEEEEATDQTNVEVPKVEKSDANAEDSAKDESEKTDNKEEGTHSESREKKAEDKKAEHKEEKAQASQEKVDNENEASPDKSDKPNPRKEPKSFNEMSGKQQGMSNDDTHHTSQISKQPEKSKKGEGVAETAKLKGTVSTDRPGAENKEERGKASMDKDA
ncbi:uncharacterized protein EKO05_0005322 [Ascochyta rabiei]|uniref:Uncharacterized protein n=1 Tax=Didymella rabiei TaxID=5454 RepID=A0A163G8G9_DIDRA|nr:uncharacterized protein EKO05_0005322 [Ascochyta rabiei]KZM24739.1 hypothetical protein ST47_g4100 [Ascochyta rabiei]UPX14851.1 hypothetical protein EKO05_0005322 [Ascochyta rabiei]